MIVTDSNVTIGRPERRVKRKTGCGGDHRTTVQVTLPDKIMGNPEKKTKKNQEAVVVVTVAVTVAPPLS
jgi:hypothetical protein